LTETEDGSGDSFLEKDFPLGDKNLFSWNTNIVILDFVILY
jgi:hypothetical protein